MSEVCVCSPHLEAGQVGNDEFRAHLWDRDELAVLRSFEAGFLRRPAVWNKHHSLNQCAWVRGCGVDLRADMCVRVVCGVRAGVCVRAMCDLCANNWLLKLADLGLVEESLQANGLFSGCLRSLFVCFRQQPDCVWQRNVMDPSYVSEASLAKSTDTPHSESLWLVVVYSLCSWTYVSAHSLPCFLCRLTSLGEM